MKSITVKRYSISRLSELCDNGVFAVPEVQREFVWDRKRASDLLDSIFKQLPIGCLLVWRTISAGLTLLTDTTLDTGGDVYFAGTLDLNGHTLDSAAPLLFSGTIANSDTSDAGTLASDVTLAADATIDTAGLVYATGTFDLSGHTLSGSTPLALDGGVITNSNMDDNGTVSAPVQLTSESSINVQGNIIFISTIDLNGYTLDSNDSIALDGESDSGVLITGLNLDTDYTFRVSAFKRLRHPHRRRPDHGNHPIQQRCRRLPGDKP